MSMFAIANVLAGAVLGQRFTPFILLPTSAVVMTIVIASGLVRGNPIWWAVLMAFAASTALQLGYLAGAFIRHALLVGRSSPLSPSSTSRAHPALDRRD